MVLLQNVENRWFLTVPKSKRDRLKLKKGDEFDVEITENNNLLFIKIKDRSKK